MCQSMFFFSILGCSQNGHHLEDNLANFFIIIHIWKIEKCNDPDILLVYSNYKESEINCSKNCNSKLAYLQLMHIIQNKEYITLIMYNQSNAITCLHCICLKCRAKFICFKIKLHVYIKTLILFFKQNNTLSLGSNLILKISWFFG